MVRIEVDVPTSMGGFPVEIDGHCQCFLDDRTSRKESQSNYISVVNWMADIKLLRWLKKFCDCSGP
jgi:hypothetical protein